MQSPRPLILTAVAAIVVGLVGCSKPAPDATAAAAATKPADAFPGMEADLQRTLKEQSDFYHFKTMADFANDTKGLVWEDGSDLDEFADPAAKKGGTITLWEPDFPGTLRTIGPNATGGIRPLPPRLRRPFLYDLPPQLSREGISPPCPVLGHRPGDKDSVLQARSRRRLVGWGAFHDGRRGLQLVFLPEPAPGRALRTMTSTRRPTSRPHGLRRSPYIRPDAA